MRSTPLLLLALLLFCPVAQGAERYGVALDTTTYPQATPQEALASVLKAIEAKRFDYLIAQLADPTFIDDRIKRIHAGVFADQVRDTQTRLDPFLVKQLARFLKEGKWTIDKNRAIASLEDVSDRCVRLTRKEDRWYLEHSFAPPER